MKRTTKQIFNITGKYFNRFHALCDLELEYADRNKIEDAEIELNEIYQELMKALETYGWSK